MMKYIISVVTIVVIVLVSATLIFDWGRKNNSSLMDQSGEIVIDTPRVNSVIGDKVKISGKARGSWYFEASFPIQIQDSDGNILATSTATAESDWMTEDFVPFSSLIMFSVPTTTSYGKIVFKNDNPSGDPVKDKFFEIPVSFSK